MSELRWNWVYYPYLDDPNKQEESALKAGYIKVVSKSEADKVIAEKDEEIRKLNFQMWSARCEAAEAERDEPRLARCRYMADKFKEVTK